MTAVNESSADRIAEIRARAEATVSGPWTAEPVAGLDYYRKLGQFTVEGPRWLGEDDPEYAVPQLSLTDAEFIAHARTDVPWLLDEVERLQGQIDATRRMLRIKCAEFNDNDWPDDLHLADVVEKHLARSAQAEVKRLRADLEMTKGYADEQWQRGELEVGMAALAHHRDQWRGRAERAESELERLHAIGRGE